MGRFWKAPKTAPMSDNLVFLEHAKVAEQSTENQSLAIGGIESDAARSSQMLFLQTRLTHVVGVYNPRHVGTVGDSARC